MVHRSPHLFPRLCSLDLRHRAFIRWIKLLFLGRRRADATAAQLSQLLRRAHAYLQLERYDEAQTLLLQVICYAGHDRQPEHNRIYPGRPRYNVTLYETVRRRDRLLLGLHQPLSGRSGGLFRSCRLSLVHRTASGCYRRLLARARIEAEPYFIAFGPWPGLGRGG